jgi:ATP-dependent 26S proteasome regulatory subunit
MDVAPTVNREALERLAKNSDGLTGAWLREVVQTALIAMIKDERTLITKDDLTASLKDVLKRRGMAYRVTPYGASGQESANAYVQ